MFAFLAGPLGGVALRAIGVVALVAAAWFLWHELTSHYEAIGAAKVQAAWDADKAARIKQTTEITGLWDAQRQKTDLALSERDKARQEAADAISARSANLPQTVRDQRVPAAFVGVLRAAGDQANAARTAGEPQGAAQAPAAGADAAESSLGLIADWIAQVTAIHAECRDRVAAWVSFYAGLRSAQPQGEVQ